MASNSGTGPSDEYTEGVNLLHMSGLRFHQGTRSVTMLAKMMEERFKCEEKTAHVLQDNSCDWTKKLAGIASAGNGEFDHGSIYVAITKALMEPIEDAKIHNLVKNEGLGDDGPITFLHSWKAKMESSQIQNKTMKLYSTAWEKQQSTLKEIEKAKEYYHLRRYKLENGLRQLQADPPVLSSRAEAKLQKSMDRYRVKCEDAQEVYKNLLKMAEEGRGQDIADMRKAERKFVRFEKNRLINASAGIEKFLDMVDKLDTERSNHLNVIEDIIGVLDKINVEAETRNLEAQYLNRCKFPVFEDFDEKNPSQQDKIQTWLKKLNLRIRKRNQSGINREVILSDESDPNLVKEITISDDDSDDIKVITTSSDTDDEESDTDIFYIDEKGRNIKMKPKLQPKTKDVRAVGKHEKLPNGTGIRVQAAQKEDYYGLPNAIESDSETEVWAIPTRNRTIELDVVDRDTSPVPPKLTKKAKKQEKKTPKESTESIRPIKESKKSKNFGQTDVIAEKMKVKDKGQQKVIVESSDSDADTEMPDGAEVRTLANVKVIAIDGYIAQNRDELTFKAGQKIKQKIPANSGGMAYGWIRKGKLKRKTYGYYPANLVELKPKKELSGIRSRLSKKLRIQKFAS